MLVAAAKPLLLKLVQILIGWSPALLVGAVVALIVSRVCRARPLSVYCWVPTVILTLVATAICSMWLWRLANLRGPDSGWVAMEGMVVLPAFGLCLVLAMACWFCRPDRQVLQLHSIVFAAVMCVGPLLLYLNAPER